VNQGDSKALSQFWTDDSELTTPMTDEVLTGKDKILQYLDKSMAELKQRDLQYTFNVKKVDFPDKDTAIVNGVTEVTGKNGLFLRTARQVELVRQNGQWLIDGVSDIELPPAPPVHNKLKDLDWVIGNWVDQDNDVNITFNNSWDKFRNFILSRFKMSIYGNDAKEGMQIIGWDPTKQTLQSWVFDSDGGFGSGTWTKKGDSWEVTIDFTFSDGKKASATNVYTKVDNDHYKFASIDRKFDGQPLPDIEPVTVKREES
jgi:hypothetical protein